mmetsp:Transcript_5842/g.14453  ORF Transcript_5842/g.14453 Transcript_5842/m.14453 type:complete len:228 (+) Transcript_5842:83-766(+)
MAFGAQNAATLIAFVGCVALVSGHSPVFDYTFAANCPVCKKFGNGTLKELYQADGFAKAVDFEVHAAVRLGTHGQFECVLEMPGCPMTKYMLCALESSPANIMEYLNCWNEYPVMYPLDYFKTAPRAEACAQRANMDWETISACWNGSQGHELLQKETNYFTERFPEFAHPGMGKPFGVPHVFIDSTEMGPKGWAEKVEYGDYVKMLCEKGMKAPACNNEEIVDLVV